MADVASPSTSPAAPRKPRKDSEKRHSLPVEKLEIVRSMDDWLCENVEKKILKSVESSWQPQDFLPSPESPDFLDQVRTTLILFPSFCFPLSLPDLAWLGCCR